MKAQTIVIIAVIGLAYCAIVSSGFQGFNWTPLASAEKLVTAKKVVR